MYQYSDFSVKHFSGKTKTQKQVNKKAKSRRRKRQLNGVSKQRRDANKRERERLKKLKAAFQNLKEILPLYKNEEESITKIEIVKIACKTIQYLSEMVQENNRNDIDLLYYSIAETETPLENHDEDVEDMFSKYIQSVENINFIF